MNLKGAEPERFGTVASFLYRRWAEPALAPLYRRVGAEIPVESGRLLDVGCGPGRLARLLAAASPSLRVLGLDSSPAMIRQAESGPKLPNLEFREGSVETADLAGQFDFAVTVLSFHHWEEPRGGLEAVYRSLAPGGRFWIYEPDAGASEEDLRRDHAPLWGWLRVPAWLQRLMARGHGFSEREVDEVVVPVIVESSFRGCEVSRRGSTFRFALRKV